ncbi:hypothetical protein GCM10023237_42980 [Streptomyces coeruleoprunus]
MAGLEVGEQLGEGLPAALDGLGAVGVGAEDGRDADLDGHGVGSCGRRKRAGLEAAAPWAGGTRGAAVRWSCATGRGSGGSAAGTDGAGEAAQVDVQPRHEQDGARRLFAHVDGNHAGIVTIPGPRARV